MNAQDNGDALCLRRCHNANTHVLNAMSVNQIRLKR